ncbi:MAG: 4-(cytidine 5'-diphospho)-2-C-methyl-D-erythritol kinase [Gammaproteobacteria bacterium]|nr:MAG: 4-(cytidine 5'-diphospho)-2-C-methyl-D-erythritol kinase [Gammaproteobacteria bacterium]
MTPQPNTSLHLPSPAKLNLFLHVLGRRNDGYHNLQTLFQFLDYSDEMVFTATDQPDISLTTVFPGLASQDNLIYKAAVALQQHTDCQQGAVISIEKKLPMGGGLGGGSSNAATTLLGLNKLWKTHCSIEELSKIGVILGADVPVFIQGQSAWAEGIGEQLKPVKVPEPWFLVLTPNCHVDTGEIFRNKHLTRDTSPIRIAAFLTKGGKNDLQDVVCNRYPEVRRALNLLGKFGDAKMTGSGSCVFCSFNSETEAQNVYHQIQHEFNGFIAKGHNFSITHRALEKLNENDI